MTQTTTKKTVLVLGASGRVAEMLAKVWLEKPSENIIFVRVARKAGRGVDCQWAPGDNVAKLPRADAVVALWGVVPGGGAPVEENIDLARTAQQIGTSCGADRVIHASSVAVYTPSDQVLDESAPCVPRNAYGRAKLQMETAVSKSSPRSVCLRIANVAGADGVFSALAGDGPITLDQFADGTGPRRSYVQPSTLAQVIETLVSLPTDDLPQVINVAGKTPVAMQDIVVAADRPVLWRAAPQEALPVMAVDVGRLNALVDLGAQSTDAVELVQEWRKYGGGV